MDCRLPRQPIMILQLLYPPVIFTIHDVTHLTVCAMQLHVSEFTYLLGNPDEPLRHILDCSCGNFCETRYEVLDG